MNDHILIVKNSSISKIFQSYKKNGNHEKITGKIIDFSCLYHLLREEVEEHRGEWGFKFQFLMGDGMDERKPVGMQPQPVKSVVDAAIFIVAHDGMPQRLHVDAYLILASGVEVKVEE